MEKRKIYAIGETLLDIIFKDGQPAAAKPGGAMLNTCISLGRLNLPVHFITEYGIDQTGNLIDSFLKQNHVNTSFASRYSEGKTALAMAFLNEEGEATYDFYKQYPEKRLDIKIPSFKKDDILLFGSFYALTPKIRVTLSELLKQAKENDTIILYDPNFRKSHFNELEELRPMIEKNINYSNIIRSSNEDFQYIYNTYDGKSTYSRLDRPEKMLIYTQSSSNVSIFLSYQSSIYPVPSITPVSTIGAGDTFNAGIIYGLLKNNVTFNEIGRQSAKVWEDIINLGIRFSQNVCMSLDNYISQEFANLFNN